MSTKCLQHTALGNATSQLPEVQVLKNKKSRWLVKVWNNRLPVCLCSLSAGFPNLKDVDPPPYPHVM